MTRPAERAPSGAELVPASPTGPGDAGFDALFLAERARVVAAVVALSRDAAVAEEIAQEAFLRLHQHWDRIAGYERPDLWVRRVAVNLALSRRRRRANEERALRRLGGRPSVVVRPPEAADDAVWAAVRALPRRQAQCIALHLLADMSVAEVAAALGCSAGSVQTHLFRARAALARALAPPEARP